MCIAVGPHHKMNLPSFNLHQLGFMGSKCVKYLGVNFLSGSRIMCDVDLLVFCASNCIFAYSSSFPEILQLHLQQILLFANLAVC